MKKIHLTPYRKYVKGVGIHVNQKMNTVNNVAFIKEKGKLTRHTTHYCFGDLNMFYHTKQPWDYVLLQVNDKQAYDSGSSKEILHTYYEWLLNLSLFRSSFVSKNVSRVLKDKVIVLDPSDDSRMVINAMVAARLAYLGECGTSTRIGIWYDMIQMGVDPAQAFTLCSFMVRDDGLGLYKMRANNGHEVFKSGSQVAHLNFLEQKLKPEGLSFKEIGGYESIDAFFEAKRDTTMDMYDFINQRWVKTTQTTNVFGAPVKAAASVDKDTFLSMLKEITTDYSSKLKELKVI